VAVRSFGGHGALERSHVSPVGRLTGERHFCVGPQPPSTHIHPFGCLFAVMVVGVGWGVGGHAWAVCELHLARVQHTHGDMDNSGPVGKSRVSPWLHSPPG